VRLGDHVVVGVERPQVVVVVRVRGVVEERGRRPHRTPRHDVLLSILKGVAAAAAAAAAAQDDAPPAAASGRSVNL